MTVLCRCFTAAGYFDLTDCLRFRLIRDRYAPDASLDITMRAPSAHTEPLRVQFSLNGTLLHDGFVRTSQYVQENGLCVLRLRTRAYSSVLTGNQLVPGLYFDVTLASLMTAYQLPQITYQQGGSSVRYLCVKENAGMWDTLTAFSYKLCGGYPYVRVPNLLCVSPQTGGSAIVLPADALLMRGEGTSSDGMISRIDMADLDGTYGAYTASNPAAVQRGITRVRQILMDRQFLYDPDDALRFRIACSNRRMRSVTLRYAGYCGEDCEDLCACGDLTARVSRITLTCADGVLTTEDVFYFDDFCNVT